VRGPLIGGEGWVGRREGRAGEGKEFEGGEREGEGG